MFTATLILALTIPQAGQAVQPPRDPAAPRRAVVDSAAREAALQKKIAASPNAGAAKIEPPRLQEDRGAVADAELTLTRARRVSPTSTEVMSAIAGFYNRRGDFAKTIEVLEAIEHLDPSDASAPYMTATFYQEKAFKDHRLLPTEKYTYVLNGIAATDRALALKPAYMEAMVYKNILLRMRAELETDAAQKQQ